MIPPTRSKDSELLVKFLWMHSEAYCIILSVPELVFFRYEKEKTPKMKKTNVILGLIASYVEDQLDSLFNMLIFQI